jgi:hypothetical protein
MNFLRFSNPRPTAASILAAADKQLGRTLGGLVDPDARDRKAYYNRHLKAWIVEYDTDPAIRYVAKQGTDGLFFESID